MVNFRGVHAADLGQDFLTGGDRSTNNANTTDMLSTHNMNLGISGVSSLEQQTTERSNQQYITPHIPQHIPQHIQEQPALQPALLPSELAVHQPVHQPVHHQAQEIPPLGVQEPPQDPFQDPFQEPLQEHGQLDRYLQQSPLEYPGMAPYAQLSSQEYTDVATYMPQSPELATHQPAQEFGLYGTASPAAMAGGLAGLDNLGDLDAANGAANFVLGACDEYAQPLWS